MVCGGRILARLVSFVLLGSLACGRGPKAPAASCQADQRLALGACVPPALAARLCGSAAFATPDGCAPRPPCDRGRARDLASGECLAARDVRTLASTLGIMVAEDEVLVCHDAELVSGVVETSPPGPRLGCLPRPLATRALPWPVVTPRGVDVGAWLRMAIGPEGGPGAPPLCEAMRRSVGALAAAVTMDVRVEVSLVFPDNDVTQLVAEVRGAGAGTAELDGVVRPMFEALRNLGGTADQSSIGTSVTCRRASERPQPERTDEEIR